MKFCGHRQTRHFSEYPSDVQRIDVANAGSEFLGFPVCGSEEFFNQAVSKRVDKVFDCQSYLSELENPQVKLLLLRSCLSLCKINSIIRTVLSAIIKKQLCRFDAGMRYTFKSITHSSISDTAGTSLHCLFV